MKRMTAWVMAALALSVAAAPAAFGQGPAPKAEAPRLVSSPRLTYPDALKRARAEGTVVVVAIIDATGRPERSSLQVLETGDQRLNESAKEFVAGSRYRAGRIDGKTVAMPVQVPVRFELRR